MKSFIRTYEIIRHCTIQQSPVEHKNYNSLFLYFIFVIPKFLMTVYFGLHQIAHEDIISHMKDLDRQDDL